MQLQNIPAQPQPTLTPEQIRALQHAQAAQHGNVPLPPVAPQPVQQFPDSNIPNPSQQTVTPLTREQSIQQLKSVASESDEVMASADTIFPLTLFPDTITVDRNKVTISERFFFRIAEVTSIRIEDVLSATSTVGPFFGAVKIISRVNNKEQEIEVGPMWRGEAERMKRIIHGYVIAKQRAIDTSQLGTKELAHMLDEVGRDEH